MKDRIIQFLTAEKISPAEFADKIGVQRSSMSHILNGRNYPSASFLQKMLQAYPALNPRWLMIGDGTMNMESVTETTVTTHPVSHFEEPVSETQTVLFPDQETTIPGLSVPETKHVPLITVPKEHTSDSEIRHPFESVSRQSSDSGLNQSAASSGGSEQQEKISVRSGQSSPVTPEPSNGKEIEQVLFFYKDKTFSIYRPS